jgi:hypothetical protein
VDTMSWVDFMSWVGWNVVLLNVVPVWVFEPYLPRKLFAYAVRAVLLGKRQPHRRL